MLCIQKERYLLSFFGVQALCHQSEGAGSASAISGHASGPESLGSEEGMRLYGAAPSDGSSHGLTA